MNSLFKGLVFSALVCHFNQNAYANMNEPFKLNCWDGTFAYNAIAVAQVEDGYEVSFHGSTLGALKFKDYESSGWDDQSIHAKFASSKCTAADKSIHCDAEADGTKNSNIFIDSVSGHPNTFRVFAISRLTLSTEASNVSLVIQDSTNEGETNKVQTIQFPAHSCNHGRGPQWGIQPFSAELRAFLKN